ncbi:glycoside hydrolase [Spongiivirga citrea]|uniref:Endo-1,4-beta-xylanase n=1 Tax=Spongiivirga citrea TaxID=1481457 RepID=A0A6M0CIT0_9FLAO|nr:glycoside hydrolase [Spongiivirga citrea]NER17866.1 endo-1,4-beta-xylanase [Spongiivirga citrea]
MKKGLLHLLNRVSLILTLLVSCDTFSQPLKVVINHSNTFQQIDGFGASDAWRCQYVGANWSKTKKDKIATLLFSQEDDADGNPKGIGLSIWRFYIGAGTTEQGAASDIKNEWRRAESFIDSNGNYDWSKQEGQQWFLKKAKEHGVERFLAFSISAPVHWTLNGKGYGEVNNGLLNLKENKYQEYAAFLVEVVNHFKQQGIYFNYLSPINEPQWDWEKKTQEGTSATNDNIHRLSNLLDDEIKNKRLATKIVLAEAADLRWLYSDFKKPRRGNQIEYFFDGNSDNSLKNKPTVENTISGHSYFTTWPVDSLISIRQKLNAELNSHDVGYWQSEFCILENTDDIGGGRKRDLGMDTALYVARVIHADLTLANAKSWQWWTALTNADFKDGLIYLDTGITNKMYDRELLKYDGEFHDSKLLWALGNYSKFVRPGMKRIGVSLNSNLSLRKQYENVMISAYLDEKTSKIVTVAINYSTEATKIKLDGSSIDFKTMFVTSKNKSLEKTTILNNEIILEPRSVSTLVGVSAN